MVFHAPTTLLLTAMLFMVLPIMVWLALLKRADRAVAIWCMGSALAGVGIALIGWRAQGPVVLTYHVANVCLMGSFVFWTQSLRTSMERPWGGLWWLTLLVLASIHYSVLFAWMQPSERGLWMRMTLGVLAMYTATWAFLLARRSGGSNAAIIGVVYLVLGLGLFSQDLWAGGFIANPNPYSNTWDAGVVAMVAMVAAMVGHFCYVGMVLDLSAREQLQALQAQREAQQTQPLEGQLRRMDRRRRVVIVSGSLAHELNQPLTAAMVNAQLAHRQWRTDPSVTPMLFQLLGHIESNIERATRILQRIRSGRDEHGKEPQALDLQVVVDQVIALLANDFHRQGVVLELARCERPLVCLGDEVGLSQVLVNLLRNAAQAMAGSAVRTVSIRCAQHRGQAQVKVCDSGPGLSNELIKRWGEPFLSTRHDGLGMGLAISRDIVQQHRGELSLCNRAEGGVMAVVSIPLLEGDEA